MAEQDQGEADGSLKVWGGNLSEEPRKSAEAGLIAEMVKNIEANWLSNAEIRLKYEMEHA